MRRECNGCAIVPRCGKSTWQQHPVRYNFIRRHAAVTFRGRSRPPPVPAACPRREPNQLIKKLFGKKDGAGGQQYTIDDLIVLERYADAEARILEELRYRGNDLNLHLKLADVYVGLRHVGKAIDEYGFVADKYAADGFHDRAIAVLTKARRLNPMDDTLAARIEKLETSRKLGTERVILMLHTDCGARSGDLDALAREAAAEIGGDAQPMVYEVDARELRDAVE